MPHAELKFSGDLQLQTEDLLQRIEHVILAHDPGAGECKGRAYPVATYHHTHCLIEVSMLPKPHRTPDFMQTLLSALEAEVRRHLTQQCFLSVGLRFSDENYLTTEHVPGRS